MVTASRIWLLPTLTQTQSRSAWEMAWAALAAQLRVSVGSGPMSVAIGDFNGDGKQDLAVANFRSGTVSIRLGDGLGGFSGSTEVSVGSIPESVAIGDFNGDGKQDLAVANADSDTVSIRLGDGLGGFSGSTEVSVGTLLIRSDRRFQWGWQAGFGCCQPWLRHSLDPPGRWLGWL